VLRNVDPACVWWSPSRADPPLRLHRYRLAGELAEIRARDLAFNIAEAGPAHGPATAARFRATHSRASRGGLKAGRPAFAWRRSHGHPIPTLTIRQRADHRGPVP